MNRILSPTPLLPAMALTLVRLVTGFFMIYHGWEVFNTETMNGYLQWDLFKNSSSGKMQVYIGKSAELVGGLLLLLGLFTRIAAGILVITMAYITFFIGHGKVWYEDQHPFLFVLLGILFSFMGGGRWSMDYFLFNEKKYSNAR